MARRLIGILAGILLVAALAPAQGLRAGPPSAGPFPSEETFVEQQFRDLLGRDADDETYARWLDRLRATQITPENLVERFLSSRSGRVVFPATRLYLAALGRRPDHRGLSWWTGDLRRGTSLVTVADAFVASREFTRRYGELTDRQLVAQIYLDVLGRPAEPGGLNHWSRALGAGVLSRGGFLLSLSESREHRERTRPDVHLAAVYEGLLDRAPTPAEVEDGRRVLTGGLRALVGAVLGSEEYTSRIAGLCDPASRRYCAPPPTPGEPLRLSGVPPHTLYLPDVTPAGLRADYAALQSSSIVYHSDNATLYGNPGIEDPLAAPVLLAGQGFEESPTPRADTPGFRAVSLGDRQGAVGVDRAWTWVTWEGLDCQCPEFVVGRNTTEAVVLAAGRAAIVSGDAAPTVPAAGLPPAMVPLVSGRADVELSFFTDAQRVTYRAEEGFESIKLHVTEADERFLLLLRFWIEGASTEVRGSPGAAGAVAGVGIGVDAGPRPVASAWYEQGEAFVAVASDGSAESLGRFVTSLAPAGADDWQRLREQVRDETDIAERCSLDDPNIVLEGRASELRWGVGFDARFACSVILTLGGEHDTSGYGSQPSGPPGHLSLFTASVFGRGTAEGTFSYGAAPPGTARVRVERGDGTVAWALLADVGPRPGERWYAAFTAVPQFPIVESTVIAFDATGRELDRRRSCDPIC